MKNWNTDLIPDQTGKVAIVTGGNIGLGFEISLQLAKKGATVIIACRTVEKGEKAVRIIQKMVGHEVNLQVIKLDLTDINSIQDFALEFKLRFNRLDLLINNAGVVNLKRREVTSNGIEMHMATNHYGHFALTGLLYQLIRSTPNARVVTMSSLSYKSGNLNFDDLNWESRPYHRGKSYGDSKLANLLFMVNLQKKFEEDGSSAMSVAAHPGLSATERQQTIGIGGWITKQLAQPVWKGALPTLKAGTDADVQPKEYYGPKYGLRGYPKIVKMDKKVFDQQVAQKLWEISEEITGVKF